MNTQPNLFDDPDAIAALEAKEEGITRALYHADYQWTNAARWAVKECAARGEPFTADDIWTWLNEHCPQHVTHEASALGPIIRGCAQDGMIVKTGETRPTRFKHRHRELTVWRARK